MDTDQRIATVASIAARFHVVGWSVDDSIKAADSLVTAAERAHATEVPSESPTTAIENFRTIFTPKADGETP